MVSPLSGDNSKPTGEEIKQAVRTSYASRIAQRGGGCCGPDTCCGAVPRQDLIDLAHYSPDELAGLPADAVENSLGCGNPLAFAGVRPGNVVLDIGSGAGIDVLLASRIVGPEGKVIGLDMTPEMIDRARENAAKAGVANVEFRLGDAEQMPIEGSTVDWVISNCVINLAPDKRKVFAEVFRVLKPGGRVSISDIVTGELPAEVRDSIALWANCIGGAIDEREYLRTMLEVGLTDIQVVARQRYDEDTVRAMVESNFPSMKDRKLVEKLLNDNPGLLDGVWSAKITARKPA